MTESIRPQPVEKSLERQIRAFHWIRLLAELSGRTAGTDQEGEAGRRVQSCHRELGLDEISCESVPSRPRTGSIWALHLALGALGCAFGGIVGFPLAALAAISFRREATGGTPLVSRWLSARDSQNVVARVGSTRPRRRVVLLANLDAPQTTRWFGGRWADHFASPRGGGGARRDRRPGERDLPRGMAALPAIALGAAALVTAASALGAAGEVAVAVRAIAAIGLAVGALAAAKWARTPASPGANDNASGVAAMLTAVEQLAAQLPPGVELWCAAVGAGQVGSQGMRALLDSHPEWQSDATAFVNFACVGGGSLRYARSEGALARTFYPPMLTELARRVSAGGSYGEVAPADLAIDTGGQLAARCGAQVLTLVAVEPNGLPRDFCSADDLPEHVDTELVIRAADFACCVVSAYLRGDADPLAYV